MSEENAVSEPSTRDDSAPLLHIEHYGSQGPHIVLAHGFGGSARNFRPQARLLRERFRVAVYDARGHARSAAPQQTDVYTLVHLVRDMGSVAASFVTQPNAATRSDVAPSTAAPNSAQPNAVVPSFGPPSAGQKSKAIVGGLSLGAMTALLYALERPNDVDRLVLAALPPGSDAQADAVGRQKRQWALDFADCIEAEGLEVAGGRFVWGESSRFDPQGAALIRQGFLEHPAHALTQLLRSALAALPSVDGLAPRLRALTLPVLVVVGSEDKECLASCERVATLLPSARLIVVPGAGHVVNLAKPNDFNQALLEFLA